MQPILVAGSWRTAAASDSFRATNPKTGEPLPEQYPVSRWSDINAALQAASEAFDELQSVAAEQRGDFLDAFAGRIENRKAEIVAMAAAETALPEEPRLASVELPRTVGQLRQAAQAARERTWALPTIDTRQNIRSMLSAIGPVAVFGPNNFPLAFNSAAGGDFASAVAAGNPVIAKANTSHPGTTKLLTEEAFAAAQETKLPAATVQLLYRMGHEDGARLVADPRLGATGYTGSREAGLTLKKAADQAGKPIYLELSSINPVVILPGALRERSDKIAEEFQTSCLMGTGQFCTNPGLVLLLAGPDSETFLETVVKRFESAPVGILLGKGVQTSLAKSVERLTNAGAAIVTGGKVSQGSGYSYSNTLLRVAADRFVADPEALQTEAFGNESLFVFARDLAELQRALRVLEGNLTGCIYSHTGGDDDVVYGQIAPILRRKVGRLLNDKMPTGVAVSAAMNHGGPFPATGHPGFTAVGIPASLRRFAMLECYDNVRAHRLPPELRNQSVPSKLWRYVDGAWTQADIVP